jgi:hypothetical protein
MLVNDCHKIDFNYIGFRFGGNAAGDELHQRRFQQNALIFKSAGGDNGSRVYCTAH